MRKYILYMHSLQSLFFGCMQRTSEKMFLHVVKYVEYKCMHIPFEIEDKHNFRFEIEFSPFQYKNLTKSRSGVSA